MTVSLGRRLPEDARRLYLAGPMRGYPLHNFPAFHVSASRLREQGFEVWSPAEQSEAEGFDAQHDEQKPLRYYMLVDLPAVLSCDAVAVLPGWHESTGARLEVHVAQTCGLPVLDAGTLEPITENELGG